MSSGQRRGLRLNVCRTFLSMSMRPTAPTLDEPPVQPSPPILLHSGSIDYDNDPISYIYKWSLNGIVSNAANNPPPQHRHHQGQYRTVEVTPVDPLAAGQSSRLDIEIVNAAPDLSPVSIPQCQTIEALQCTATASDVDPADLSSLIITYEWTNLTTGAILHQ